MYFVSSDYLLATNGHTMLNACDCFMTWNSKERACQTKDIFSIKKLVISDGCDSKPRKIKKTVTKWPTKWGIKAWGLADSANGYLRCTTTYRKFLGKMASYLLRQFFHLHKSYENAIGTRNVQLWHC